MTRVLVVGTYHEEKGLVTVPRLVAILERIRPEVIFLELPSAALGDFLDGTRSNLESTAVRQYRENREVLLVPVDLPEPDEGFFRGKRFLVQKIERTSREYCRLIDENARCIERSGFAYLNSERSSQALSAIHEEMRDTVEWLADRRAVDHRRVIEVYESWTTMNERREEAMLRGIDDYSRLQPFTKGVFLIGAAHRRSILTKARERAGDVLSRIDGDLSEFSDVFGE